MELNNWITIIQLTKHFKKLNTNDIYYIKRFKHWIGFIQRPNKFVLNRSIRFDDRAMSSVKVDLSKFQLLKSSKPVSKRDRMRLSIIF